YSDISTFRRIRFEQFFRQRFLYVLLDGPFKGTCPVLLIEAFFTEEVFGSFRDLNGIAQLIDALKQLIRQDINDLEDIFFLKRTEGDNIINTIEKFRIKDLFKGILNRRFHPLVIHIAVAGGEANALAETSDIASPD